MLRLVADQNFNGDIVRGLLFIDPALAIVRVQDVGLARADDLQILAWAAANDRIVLTHDRATMPDHAYSRVAAGGPMAGVFVVNDRLGIGIAINEIRLLDECSEQADWIGRVIYLPL
jgi:hypothetical protein